MAHGVSPWKSGLIGGIAGLLVALVLILLGVNLGFWGSLALGLVSGMLAAIIWANA